LYFGLIDVGEDQIFIESFSFDQTSAKRIRNFRSAAERYAVLNADAIAFEGYDPWPAIKAPVAAQKVFSWTGYYVGVNGGYAWDKAPTNVQPGPSGPIFVNLLPQVLDPRPRGYFGGGQIGSNWQYGSFVFGMESDLQSGISGTVVQSPIIQNNGTPFPGIPVLPGNNSVTISQKLDWWSTSRLRAGTTFVDPRLLLFVTAGAATAGISNTATTDFRPAGTTRYPVAFSETRVGLVVGAGAEWAFTNNLSIKAEYLFLDFGSSSMTTTSPFATAADAIASPGSATGD